MVGCGLGDAIKHSNISTLFLTIVGLFIGLIWLFPMFSPEEKRDEKL